MKDRSFRLKTPTLGILSIDTNGHRIPVTLPLHAIVTLADGQIDGNRLVDVLWENTTIMMFAQDLRERGVEI
jgi:hypothetical protein